MLDKDRLIFRLMCCAFWIMGTVGFVCTDLFTALIPARTYIEILVEAVVIAMGVATIRNRRDVWVVITFVLLVVAAAVINGQTPISYLNGCRQFLGLLFIPPVVRYVLLSPYARDFVRSFDRQLYIFLWLQVVCIGSQFLRYGAGDHGGGTLGNYFSGAISTIIYLISFYLMNKRWDRSKSYIKNLLDNKWLVILLMPTFFNETKVSLVFFVAYFVLLMKIDKAFILRLIISSPLVVVAAGFSWYAYASTVNTQNVNADYFMDYLVGLELDDYIELSMMVHDEDIETDNIWTMDLPRIGRFIAVPGALKDCAGGMLLGPGVGQFKGGSKVAQTGFAVKYAWLLDGSPIYIFFLIMQLGILGVIWGFWAVFSLCLTPDHHQRNLNIKFYVAMVMILIMIYNTSFTMIVVMTVLTWLSMRGLQPSDCFNEEETSDEKR